MTFALYWYTTSTLLCWRVNDVTFWGHQAKELHFRNLQSSGTEVEIGLI